MQKMNTIVIAGVALAAMAGSAMGQQINAGNARFEYTSGAVPTTGTATSPGAANLNTNVASNDQLFATWWHYRVQGVDTREFAYNAAANPFVAAGNQMTGTFNLPNFRSDLRYVLTDTDGAGTSQALLQQFNTVTNTSSTTQTINIFSYADFDPAGSFSHPYSYNSSTGTLTGSSGSFTFNYKGFGATAYQANDFSIIRTALTDAAATNLNNTVDNAGPNGPGSGDFTGAFQWTFTLQPGQSIELLAVLAINTPAVPAPGAVALAGLAGLVGLRRRR